jgi:uncharacterized protein involved in exopolysaccharide biosynthesis
MRQNLPLAQRRRHLHEMKAVLGILFVIGLLLVTFAANAQQAPALPASSSDDVVLVLRNQRDYFLNALADSESRILRLNREVAALRSELLELKPRGSDTTK